MGAGGGADVDENAFLGTALIVGGVRAIYGASRIVLSLAASFVGLSPLDQAALSALCAISCLGIWIDHSRKRVS
jgi:hypothetical protein